MAGLIHVTVVSDQGSWRLGGLKWLRLMSALHVFYNHPADQHRLAHIVVAGLQEMVEMCKGNRFYIHMKFFFPHSPYGYCKGNKRIPDSKLKNRLHFLMGATVLPFLQSATDS